ncbi:carbonic anhydrase 12 [Pelodytes ibericus]
MYTLLLTLLTLPAAWAASDGHSWAYSGHNGESTWPINYGFCGGAHQSPLNFHRDIMQYDSTLVPIRLHGYNASSSDLFTLSNNGHTVSMSIPPTMQLDIPPFQYIASSLHFHWGNSAHPKGSEHCIEGKRFAAEVHIVHYNSKYMNLATAMEAADGLAVLGILLQVGSFNPSYDRIFSQLSSIQYKDQKVQIAGFNLQELVPGTIEDYYRYKGSLTTPPCNPSVLWTVFRKTVLISEEQLQSLETTLYSSDGNRSVPVAMTNNYRSVQAEGGRLVSVSFREGVILAIVMASILGMVAVLGVTCYLFSCVDRIKERRRKKVAYKAAVAMEETTSHLCGGDAEAAHDNADVAQRSCALRGGRIIWRAEGPAQ